MKRRPNDTSSKFGEKTIHNKCLIVFQPQPQHTNFYHDIIDQERDTCTMQESNIFHIFYSVYKYYSLKWDAHKIRNKSHSTTNF